MQKSGDGIGIELGARLGGEDVEGFLLPGCRSIGATGSDGVERVGHGDDPGAEGISEPAKPSG